MGNIHLACRFSPGEGCTLRCVYSWQQESKVGGVGGAVMRTETHCLCQTHKLCKTHKCVRGCALFIALVQYFLTTLCGCPCVRGDRRNCTLNSNSVVGGQLLLSGWRGLTFALAAWGLTWSCRGGKWRKAVRPGAGCLHPNTSNYRPVQ